MNPVYLPLFSALAGAVIGSLSSIAAILIQAKISDRRERVRQAATLAMEEYKVQIDHARGRVLPFSLFLQHHIAVLQAIEEGDLTPERIRQIADNNRRLEAVHFEIDKELRTKGPAPPQV